MMSVRLILAIAKIHNLESKAIYFLLASIYADLEEDIRMQLPIRFQVEGQNKSDFERHYILKFNKNLYGLKQGSYNCYEKPKKSPVNQGFNPSNVDPCLYIGNVMIVLTYFADCIIVVPSMIDINGFSSK